MKKTILFIAAMLLIGTAAEATTKDRVHNRYQHTTPISFVENGTLFHVYPNGEVDFTTPRYKNRQHTYRETNYYNTPGEFRNNRRYNRPTVQYDYYGRLKKVGFTTIGYNRYDQTRRIGSVLIHYNRRGLVTKIGGLYIRYTRNGNIQYVEGTVHYTGCGYCGVQRCSIEHRPYHRKYERNRHNSSRHQNHRDHKHHKHHDYKKEKGKRKLS